MFRRNIYVWVCINVIISIGLHALIIIQQNKHLGLLRPFARNAYLRGSNSRSDLLTLIYSDDDDKYSRDHRYIQQKYDADNLNIDEKEEEGANEVEEEIPHYFVHWLKCKECTLLLEDIHNQGSRTTFVNMEELYDRNKSIYSLENVPIVYKDDLLLENWIDIYAHIYPM